MEQIVCVLMVKKSLIACLFSFRATRRSSSSTFENLSIKIPESGNACQVGVLAGFHARAVAFFI